MSRNVSILNEVVGRSQTTGLTMSGFGFGGFDFSNISENFGDIGDRLQKLKEDVEQTIDASLKEESPEGGIEEDESEFISPSLVIIILI